MKLRSDTFIKSERLFLRQIDETDANAIVLLRSSEEVYKYFCYPKKITVADHNKWFKDIYSLDDDRIDWIAVDDTTGKFIGVYGAKKDSEDTIEVSYITNPEYYGHGYATEAVDSIIRWCKKNWNARCVKAVVHKENQPSIRFARGMGFETNTEASASNVFLVMEKKLDN